jgi:hypothetical protein
MKVEESIDLTARVQEFGNEGIKHDGKKRRQEE